MIYIEDTIVEIEAGSVDDQTAQEQYATKIFNEWLNGPED